MFVFPPVEIRSSDRHKRRDQSAHHGILVMDLVWMCCYGLFGSFIDWCALTHPLPPQIDIFWLDWSRIVPTSPWPHLTTNGQIAHKCTQKIIRKNRNHQNSQAIYGFFGKNLGTSGNYSLGGRPRIDEEIEYIRHFIIYIYILYIYIMFKTSLEYLSVTSWIR